MAEQSTSKLLTYSERYGNFLLEEVLGISVDEAEGMSFYGLNGAKKTAEEYVNLAEAIEEAIREIAWVNDPSKVDYMETGIEAAPIKYKADCEYSAQWLRRAAEKS
jgi:hypothetical protein